MCSCGISRCIRQVLPAQQQSRLRQVFRVWPVLAHSIGFVGEGTSLTVAPAVQVPIYSLPQEWLWCESWCGEGTKARAKTIDLCNNPMTKEGKLQAARRIVAEWPALDAEATALTERIQHLLDAGHE